MTKRIICLVGKTCSGKDTIANMITSKYGIRPICSYTTRPMRDYETYGVQHKFIDKEAMSYLMQRDRVLAYSKNEVTGVEYCSVFNNLTDTTMLYIINPEGIEYIKKHYPQFELIVIYVYASDVALRKRSVARGDNALTFEKRLKSEEDIFDKFVVSGDINYVLNTEETTSVILDKIDKIVGVLYERKFK